MRSNRLHLLVSFAILSMLVTAPLFAGGGFTWWVSPTGSDATGKGSQLNPFRTMNTAYALAADGDTIRAMPGTYNDCALLTSVSLGTGTIKAVNVVADDWVVNGDNTTTILDGTGLTCLDQLAQLVGVLTIAGKINGASTVEGFTVVNGIGSGIVGLGTVTISNNVVRDNNAPSGGGIFGRGETCRYGDIVMTIRDNLVENNTSVAETARGGGIHTSVIGAVNDASCPVLSAFGNPTVLIENNVVQNNSVMGTNPEEEIFGAGIAVDMTSNASSAVDVTITQNTVTGNSILTGSGVDGYGGGIWAQALGYGSETIRITENTVSSNTSTRDGGGISAWIQAGSTADHTVLVEDNLVSLNTTGGDGGGLDLFMLADDVLNSQSLSLIARNNQVMNNQATGLTFGGGGVLGTLISLRTLPSDLATMEFIIENNRITDNGSTLAGGGLSLSIDGDGDPDFMTGGMTAETLGEITVRGNLIEDNQAATNAPGGGVFGILRAFGPGTARAALELNTIANNQAGSGAGGIEIEQVAEFDSGGSVLGANILGVNSTLITGNDGWGIGGPADGEAGVRTAGTSQYSLTVDVDFSAIGLNASGDVQTSLPQTDLDFVAGDPLVDAMFVGLPCSPTIDGGDPTLAFALEPAPNGGRVNIGHTGNTPDAGRALGDPTGDRTVDGIDLLRIATAFSSVVGQARYTAEADLTSDGMVDGDDLALIGSDFGMICP